MATAFDQKSMTPFEPDGVYNSIPYRVLPDRSIEAMMPGGLVRFRDMDQLAEAAMATPTSTSLTHSDMNGRNGSVPAKPLDYYAILQDAIRSTRQNSAQLRALVYERFRFNLKRDVLFGHSTMGLADVVRQINDFELAVARIEANAVDEQPVPRERLEPFARERIGPRERARTAAPDRERTAPPERERAEPREIVRARAPDAVQILPPPPIKPLYAGLPPGQRADNSQFARLTEEFIRHLRLTNKFVAIAFVAMTIIGSVIITLLWPTHKPPSRLETAGRPTQTAEAAATPGDAADDSAAQTEHAAKVPFPLPNSFGIYVLSNDKLTELQPLPISVPDARIALSAEITAPSPTTISDAKPAFILFRRDLLNNAPQKIFLRVIARMARETAIVNGKAGTTNIEGTWRVRNISRELRISPIPGQREMVIARLDDDVSLAAGRYALVLNRTGYDFEIQGSPSSPAFCLEKFETANGAVFNQCRAP